MSTLNIPLTAAAPTPSRAAARAKLDTPAQLRLMLGGAWVLSAVFLLAASFGTRWHRQAVQTIGKDAAPSIIAAQHLRASFAWAHADAAGRLHGNGDAAAAYNRHRGEAADELVAAAENITYGDAERVPIRRMVDAFGRYGAAVATARPTAGGLAAADRIPHDELLPQADPLDEANRDALELGYVADRGRAAWGLAATCVAGLALFAGLVATRVFLTRRTHRLVNVPLAVAAVVTVAATVWLAADMAASAADLRTAKADAFDSVSALWQARSVAVDGYASRPAGTGGGSDEADRLASPPAGTTLDAAIEVAEAGRAVPGFTGYLADELRNVTFPGEREAAVDALRAYAATGPTAVPPRSAGSTRPWTGRWP